MIHLTYANRTEALLDALVRRLDARRRRGDDPLAPIWLVVPNRNVERYVELEVARRLGIAANLRFERLATFVRRWLGDDGSLLLDTALTARVLRALVDDELLSRPALAPVRRYLHGAGDDPDAVDLRRAQLALHVSHLLEEYAFSRPELLDVWTADGSRFDGDPRHGATERWQAAIWRWLRAHPASVDSRPLSEALAAAPEPPMRELHVFGLSYVARIFSRLFGVLAERADLYLYALNPCEEFWEDLETEGELRRRRRRSEAEPEWLFEDEDPFRLSVDTETPLLRLWGRPGREHVRLLGELTGCDFTPAFVDPVPDADAPIDAGDDALPLFSRLAEPRLLARLQHDVLQRAPRRERPLGVDRDESVQVLECPSIRREVETVAAEIWRLIDALDGLTFDRIAVLVNGPDRDLYLPHLIAAFEEAQGIPFNVTDLSLASVSPLVEGALRLIALPTTRLARPDVLGVVTHPAVRGRVPDVDAHEWVALCERLGIFHGLDHAAHEGTYVGDEDLLSWEQGLTRIALGAFMTGPRSGDERFVSIDGHRYLPEEPPVGDRADARFALLVRSLSSDVRFARRARLSLTEWSRFLGAMLGAYLTPADAREEAALRRALAAVEALCQLDLDGAPVGYAVAHELARGALEDLGGGRGQHLADGVAVSSLMPMRAIPFRVIFVLGLGEGRFPAADRRDTMDLRAARRQVGDVTPPERDRYTFLETLLCARERLYLSYVGRDEQTGDRLAPSTVVAELLDVVEGEYLPDARNRIVRRPTLRRDEDERMPAVLDAAASERRARRLGEALREELAAEGRDAGLGALTAGETARRVARDGPLRAALGLPALPERAPPAAEPATVRLSLSSLRRFLECPLQAWTQRVLRLEEDQLDTRAAEADEPFAPSALDATVALRASFVEAVLRGVAPQDAYRAHVDALKARGRWPIGALEALEAAEHREVLASWMAAWEGLGDDPRAGRLRFGAATSADAAEEVVDPLVIAFDDDPRDPGSGRPLRVELSGRTQLLREEPRGSVTPLLVHKRGARGHVDQQRYALRAFFDHVALAAAGREAAHRAIQLFGDGAPPALTSFSPVGAADARAWLRDLTADLLGRPHAYLMPVEAVLRVLDGFDDVRGEALRDSIAFVRDRWGGGQSRYGPVREPLRFAPPAVGEAEEMLERRFGLLARTMERA
ncbi:MAG TPA: exodeoxyribonuclease V subunit gamma [Sandaracinaceae bacterium LLY-WYZ-13_1]|nr:exodeoxyribonuclease V subunit gamma [Sandaracinaceae bacterium LLY-WYZ-13_1]